MRSTVMIRAAKIGCTVLSAAIGALGIMLIAKPDRPVNQLCDIIGAMLAVFGIIRIIGYYSKDLYRLAFQHDFALGILLAALGLTIALSPHWAMNLLCLVLGIEIVTDGLFKVQTALDARRFGLETWWLIMAIAVIVGVVGTILIVRPAGGVRMLGRLLGASLLAQGILDLCVTLCAVKIISHQRRDAEEIARGEAR